MDRHHIGFAVAGSVLSIIFFIVVNLLTSPDYLWFIYPAFAVIIWPASVILIWRGKYKLHALFGSLLLIAFLSIINFLHSPHHPWILYTIILIIWWPISVFCGERAKTVSFALVASMCIIMYYSLLNIMMLHQYPWAIYPAYAVLWWPLALHYVRKKGLLRSFCCGQPVIHSIFYRRQCRIISKYNLGDLSDFRHFMVAAQYVLLLF